MDSGVGMGAWADSLSINGMNSRQLQANYRNASANVAAGIQYKNLVPTTWEEAYQKWDSATKVGMPLAQNWAGQFNEQRKNEVASATGGRANLEDSLQSLDTIRKNLMAGRLGTSDTELTRTRSLAGAYGGGMFGTTGEGSGTIADYASGRNIGKLQEELVQQGLQAMNFQQNVAEKLNPYSAGQYIASPGDIYSSLAAQRLNDQQIANQQAISKYNADVASMNQFGSFLGTLNNAASGAHYSGMGVGQSASSGWGGNSALTLMDGTRTTVGNMGGLSSNIGFSPRNEMLWNTYEASKAADIFAPGTSQAVWNALPQRSIGW